MLNPKSKGEIRNLVYLLIFLFAGGLKWLCRVVSQVTEKEKVIENSLSI